MTPTHWATQSPVTRPGADAEAAIDALGADLASLHSAASQLTLHYRGQADAVPASRRDEIHTRYVDAMLTRTLSRGAPSLSRDRGPLDRTVGCCRDATVLFLALARHRGVPARARVGFAAYFSPGWMVDHVVAEVWDGAEGRWRRVDPDMAPSVVSEAAGRRIDWLDLTAEDFQSGAQAWAAARRGAVDPSRYVVVPGLEVPALRGWPYLAHNVVHDLAAMNKKEMLLWDGWGMMLDHGDGPIPEAHAVLLDEVSALLADVAVEPGELGELMARDGLAIPEIVTRFDPYGGPPKDVDVSRVLGGV